MSNFSFFHSASYPFEKLSAIFIKFEIVVCNICQFGPVQNTCIVIWERVNFRCLEGVSNIINSIVFEEFLVFSFTFFILIPLLYRYSFKLINDRQLLKTLWEKKKLLVTSNFFFSHNVFYSIRKLYPHFSVLLTSYLYFLRNWKSLKLACEVKGYCAHIRPSSFTRQ